MLARHIDADTQTLLDFVSAESPDLFAKTEEFSAFLQDWRSKGTYSYHRSLTSACSRRTTIRDASTSQDRQMIVLASNNYLGLNQHPKVIAAATDALKRFGSGMCGSRLLSGTYDTVVELEDDLAAFEDKEAAMVFTSGYQANVGTVSALLRPDDAAYIDKLCHASIVDGCRLSQCTTRIFRHNDMDDLKRVLAKSRNRYRGALIIVDGVFSMDGDLAPLPEIIALAKQYDCRVMADEAHGTGVVGPTGRGASEHFGVKSDIDIVLGTFSKTLSATGGFIAAKRHVVDYVRHYGRSYMFSASVTPVVSASVKAGLRVIQEEPDLRQRLWANVTKFAADLKEHGFGIYPDPPTSAIITIPIGPDDIARNVSRDVYEAGLFVSTGCYPAVAQGHANLRLSLSAMHTDADLCEAVSILADCGRRHGVI